MARPQRNTVDYFPFICQEGKKMFYIEQTYGNDGFATFVKLLRELALSENHYLNLSEPTTLMFLSAKCRVSKEVLEAIINDLVNLGKFDKMLWNENKVIWCGDFIDSISDAYNKRNNKCITYDGLLLLLCSLGVRKPVKSKSEVPVKPQSIVEYSIEDEIKVNKSKVNQNSLLSEIKISDVEFNEVVYFEIALAYQKLFIKNLKEKNAPASSQEKATYKNYVTPIRLMMTIDNVTKEQLTKVYKYLGSIEGEFWKSNILSTSKLREKFQQLLLKSQENGKSDYKGGNRTPTDDELKEQSYNAVAKLLGRTQ